MSSVAAVEAVVVGREQQVKAAFLQLPGILIGGTEAGIARVGPAAKRGLQVHYGIVGRLDVGFKQSEAGRVVVGAVALQGGFVLRCVLHGIAGKEQVDAVGLGQVRVVDAQRVGAHKQLQQREQ